MGILTVNSDYSDRDFASLLVRLRGLITSVFPTWTDAQVANIANLLVESHCFVGDVLAYYQDSQARESRVTTARLRKNMLALVKLIGYTPSGASAATATVRFTLAAAVQSGRTVTFNPPDNPTPTNPTTVSTQDVEEPIEFELTAPVVITAGNTFGDGIVKNSKRRGPETFSATALPLQEVQLAQTPYLDGSAVVTAGNGSYTQVADFLQSTASDRHYVVVVDDQDQATIRFGNGVNGAVPTGTISVEYETGGGAAGNVVASSIKKIAGNFVDSAGDPVTVTVNNSAAATGGEDREGIEEIRENAPLSLRALTRTVSREDYQIHALKVAGVERALMLTREQDSSIAEATGKLYIVPAGIGFPTLTLKNEVLDQFVNQNKFPCTVGFTPEVVDPIYVDIGIAATIFLKPGFVAATVRTNILAALTSFFALRDADGAVNPLIDFGQNLKAVTGLPAGEIALSDVFNVIRDVNGVRKVGDEEADFRLSAYRVISTTLAYSGGGSPAVLVQALAHEDVPIQQRDFPRLKKTTLGGSVLDVDLTIDGVNFPPA